MIKTGKALIFMALLFFAGLTLGITIGSSVQKANGERELKILTEDNKQRLERLDERIEELREMITRAEKLMTKTGIASYYAEPFHGKQTASGEIYDKNKLTAASRNLPFNTHWNVVNLKTGLMTTIKINDRGPFINNRILDLSEAAAKAIGMKEKGISKIKISPRLNERN